MPKIKTFGKFTPRVVEAIDWASRDLSAKMIADKMGISKNGVESLFREARDTSRLHTRAAMVRKAIEDGQILIEIKKPSPGSE
jgi:DNA-binding NarL/FixJ family response regulator